MKKSLLTIISAALLALGFIACGDDDDDSSTASDTDTDTDTDTDADSDTDTDADTGATEIDTDSTYELDDDTSEVNKLALVVGISDYDGTYNDLNWCDEDAVDWYNYLIKKGYEVKILGDGNLGDYPVYHGHGTKPNVHKYVKNLVASADSNDYVMLFFSGHGGGSGGSSYYATKENFGYSDAELLIALAENTDIGQMFVSMDICSGGGFGPDLLGQDNGDRVHANFTCGPEGFGYDSPSAQNGLWTSAFLDWGLKNEFGSANVSMEEAFEWAFDFYDMSGDDAPEMYDGNTADPFYLDTTHGHWFETDEALVVKGNATLASRLVGTTGIKVNFTDWSDPSGERIVRNGAVTDANTQKTAYNLVRPAQRLSDRAPRCLLSHSMDFVGANGEVIGRVGICQADTLRNGHRGVLVTVTDSGETVTRHGLIIQDASAFAALVDANAR